jgi:hypothetical protein
VGVVKKDTREDSLAATLARLRRLTPHVVLVRRSNLLGYSISATLLWQLPDGKSFAKTFRDDVPATRHASPALDTLFSFYRQQPLGPWPERTPLPVNCQTQTDGGVYAIGFYGPGRTRWYSLRDCGRYQLVYEDRPLLPGEQRAPPREDPRSVWLALFEKAMR